MCDVITLKHLNHEISKRKTPTVLVCNNTILAFNEKAEKLWMENEIDLMDLIGEDYLNVVDSQNLPKELKNTFYTPNAIFESDKITRQVYLNL